MVRRLGTGASKDSPLAIRGLERLLGLPLRALRFNSNGERNNKPIADGKEGAEDTGVTGGPWVVPFN